MSMSMSPSQATLQIIPLGGAPREETLQGPAVRIGRGPENEISIADPSVSRHHAILEATTDGYTIRDLGSRNGVLINGRRIDGPTRIGAQDDIQLGDVTLKLLSRPEVTLTDLPLERTDTTYISYNPDVKLSTTILLPKEGAAPDRPGPDAVLNFLQEVTNAVLAARPFDEVLEEIIRQLLTILPMADRACLLLIEGTPPEPKPRVARHRSGKAARMSVSRTIVRRVVETLDSVLSENAQEDLRFAGTKSLILQGTFSVMCVPLVVGGKAIGALYVDTLYPHKHFSGDELRFFSTIGNIAAGHIHRQGLLEEAIQNRARERELEQASAIQRRLLAIPPVTRLGYTFLATNRPSLTVGGDYMDMIDCGEGGVVLAIGDVVGKGMGAALLMSTVHATVRAEVRAGGGPSAIGQRVNAQLFAATDPDKFVTLFLAHLDPASGRLTYANAGHDPPLLLRGGAGGEDCERLMATGLISGMMPEAPLEEETVEFLPGDLLFAYTDGLREARGHDGEEFGEERLIAALRANRDLPAEELATKIESVVFEFTAGEEQQDDMTQLLLRRDP
jgi:serine phosphatase RsbU (regulator of sigma subunit)